MDDDERKTVYEDFKGAVNMTPKELEKWLQTDESKEVGQKENGSNESVGHDSGRRIIDIREKKKADLTDSDYEHMQKVNSYVARHRKQKPSGEVKETPWRYSLMNWGHDPLKN